MSAGTTPAFSAGVVSTRRVPRYKLTVPLHLSVLRSGIPDRIPGRSIEIGEGGMGVAAASKLLLGESVRVEFLLPRMSTAIRATAVVRYQYNSCFGLQFLRLPVEQQSLIRYWTICEGDISLPGAETDRTAADVVLTDDDSEITPLPEIDPPRESNRWFSVLRILRFALPLLVVAAILGWWHWQEEWKKLESPVSTEEAGVVKPQLKVPAEVMERRVVHQVMPQYPEPARQAGIEGTVLLDAVVDADGAVAQVKPVSGPDQLSLAAANAVHWWRYDPYVVNGQPVTVETTVVVNFRLAN